MRPFPSSAEAPRKHRPATILIVALFAAGIVASAFTAATPQATAAAGKPAVVSEEIRAKLAARPGRGAEAIVTAHDRAGLDAIRRLGVRGTALNVAPMLLVKELTQDQLRALERSPAVRSVFHNKRHALQMEDSNWIIGARYAWGPSAPTRFKSGSRPDGYTGRGVDIAVIDTGIDGGHEDTDNLVEFCDTTAAATGSASEVVCIGRTGAFDDEGHGSHVSGTIAGSGDASGGIDDTHSTIGVAPEARLHVYSANVGPVLLAFQILAAYDDMIQKKQAAIAAGQPGVVATSNSFGGGDGANYSPDDPQNIMHKLAYDVGIISVYAAGNSGPEHNTLSDSCIDPWVVCVGATTKPDSVVQFSSRGRPSEPADTNRDGIVGGEGDIAPDNHDRKLGQRLGIGLYRPTLVAPGVNINSISANAAGCREGVGTDTGCYEPLNGTSMATPHVSGAIGVIVQAYRAANGLPGSWPSTKKHSAAIVDILERSAGLHKLPGYEAEEQGAGRLNVWDAVRYIRGEISLPKPNLGTPSPVYASGKFPGAAATKNSFDGCTGALSFTVGDDPNPLDEGADQPPDADTGRYGAHRINVPVGAERLRITGEWPAHPGSNLYLRLWRPGVNPNDEFSSDFSERAFPDQEAIGLADTTALLEGRRFLDVRAPEAGEWRLRVYHRAGGASLPCTTPNPNLPEPFGYNYSITTEIPISARVPTVAFTDPAGGSTHTDRVIVFKGTASYPTRWDGVTNYQVPGTGLAGGDDVSDGRVELHFQGNTEEGCGGDGASDLVLAGCNGDNGPSLLPKTALSDDSAATWKVPNPILTVDTERNIYTPNWIWDIDEETTLRGPMKVEWWGSCAPCDPLVGGSDWILRLYADGAKQFEQRVNANTEGAGLPTLLEATVDLPTITASDRIVLHIEPVYVDTQNATQIHYDSVEPCSPETTGACDSVVFMPVADPDSSAPQQAENLRVTDIHTGLRLAWDPAAGATRYEIHRSANPAFAPSAATRMATVAGTACTSPSVPTWPGASDGGALCYTDSDVAALTPYYYRVVAKSSGVLADPSLLAYGTRTVYDRQVKIKGDRLYGPGLWGYARLIGTDATRWRYSFDTLERPEGTATEPNEERVSARSFTQGIGSANQNRTVKTEGPAPETPFDPVVIFTKQGPPTARAGDTITYTLQYENLGPAPSSKARVIDTLPAGMRFVSASGGGAYDPGKNTVKWNLGTVAEGSGGTLTIRLKIRGSTPDGAIVVNEARFRAALTFATPTGVAQTTILP
ncbi:hypothetical protein BH24CHL8_BH24CHL8_05140 [soil metagenome]